MYKSFITIDFLGFFHLKVSNLCFGCVTVKTIYIIIHKHVTEYMYVTPLALTLYVPRVTNIDYLKISIHNQVK